MKRSSKVAGEVAARRWLGRNAVDWTSKALVDERSAHDLYQIEQMDPRHELASRANRTTDAQFEQREHLRKRTSRSPEDDPGSKAHHPNAVRLSAASRLLPLPAQIRQKVTSGRRLLRQQFVTAVAVDPNGAPGHEDARPRIRSGDRTDEKVRHADTARLEHRPAPCRPTSAHQRLAGEVHDGIAALKRRHE
jgi:hypothetical protein